MYAQSQSTWRKSHAHLDDEILAAFVTDNLSEQEFKRVQNHLQNCQACFENSARLKHAFAQKQIPISPTPFLWIKKAQQIKVHNNEIDQLKNLLITLIHRKYQRFMIPAIAVTTMAVIFILFSYHPSSIQNDPLKRQLMIYNTDGFGFVADREIQSYPKMHVSYHEDTDNLLFEWPEIKNAEFYHITLQKNGTSEQITPLAGITENHFDCSAQNFQRNKDMIWELSGKLIDGRSFQARAIFKLTK